MSSETLVALESVDRHPSRPHVIATGGADGCVTTFDIRGNAQPIKKIEVHTMEGICIKINKKNFYQLIEICSL